MKVFSVYFLMLTVIYAAKHGTTQTVEGPISRVTVSTIEEGKYHPLADPSLVAVRMRVENRGAEDLIVSPDFFVLKQPSGQIRRCLPVNEAIDRLLTKATPRIGMISDGLAGPIAGRNATDRRLATGKTFMLDTAFSYGVIPPGAFKEGMVYFEGTGDKARNFEGAIVGPRLFSGPLPLEF